MALEIWTQPSNYNFGVIAERSTIDFLLPVSYAEVANPAAVKFSVISGKLPPGLRLVGDRIVGTPYEVPRDTSFKFVIRASYNGQVNDRTFNTTVVGPDSPFFTTQEGLLPAGPNGMLYVLDSVYIDFSLQGVDYDTASGQKIQFSIFDGDGELPPGLMLTPEGRIVGFIQPLLAIPILEDNGNFDTSTFDKVAYDYGFRPSNGFDSWIYDLTTFDLSAQNLYPKKLNRNYEFIVTITDGDNIDRRQFRIYVVGEDHFRADSTVNRVGHGTYTTDTSYVKAPIWITPSDLGFRRANNYQTFKLDIFEDPDNGPTAYRFDALNPRVFGLTKKVSLTDNITDSQYITFTAPNTPIVGDLLVYDGTIAGLTSRTHTVNGVTALGGNLYRVSVLPFLDKDIPDDTKVRTGNKSKLPPGMQFDQGTAEVFGVIPYMPAITKEYNFTVSAIRLSMLGEYATSMRTFKVKVLGEVESVISWNTDSDLGSIDANMISTLFVKATTTLADSVLLYNITSGSLPNGMSMNLSGDIIGKANQYVSDKGLGLTTFDGEDFKLDGDTSSIDRVFTFTVQARDALGFAASTKTFKVKVETPNDRWYSNLTVRPFLKPEQRNTFKAFIRDSSIFDVNYVYRLNDPNFGIQNELKMLIYGGIETKTAGEVARAISKNHKVKRFTLGDVKVAQAKVPGTHTVVYEVIYVDVLDPIEIGKIHLPEQVNTKRSPTSITVDQTNEFNFVYVNYPTLANFPSVGHPDKIYVDKSNNKYYRWYGSNGIAYKEYNPVTPTFKRADPLLARIDRTDIFPGDPGTRIKFPSSVTLWRSRLKQLGLTERHYLPLWMRSIQAGSVQELGFVKAIPLCFCKPGTANEIYLNIKHSGFDFKKLDYVIDRYIIDKVITDAGSIYSDDKYIAFRNDRNTIT